MRGILRGAAVAVAALSLGIALLGVPTMVLQLPGVTATLVSRYYEPSVVGLPLSVGLKTAEEVRAYTTGSTLSALPEVVNGRPAFDEAAASHLRDVRAVLQGARVLTLAAAVLLAGLLAAALRMRLFRDAALALRIGTLGTLALSAAAAAWAVVDFDAFFTAFHGLFFTAGTWSFPYGALLIQLFPEPLWAAFGVLWVAGVLLGAAVALLAARALVRRNRGLAGQEV